MHPNTSRVFKLFTRLLIASSLSCFAWLAQATPVTADYSGTLSSVDSPLASVLPAGSALSFSVDFNETFSDGSYSFADNLGPVSGSLSVGGFTFTLSSYQPYGYSFSSNAVTAVRVRFTGTGPGVPGYEFYGLIVNFTTGLAIDSVMLGYDQTTQYPDYSVTSYYYATASGEGSVTPQDTSDVPLPGTLSLAALGLVGLVTLRRKRT